MVSRTLAMDARRYAEHEKWPRQERSRVNPRARRSFSKPEKERKDKRERTGKKRGKAKRAPRAKCGETTRLAALPSENSWCALDATVTICPPLHCYRRRRCRRRRRCHRRCVVASTTSTSVNRRGGETLHEARSSSERRRFASRKRDMPVTGSDFPRTFPSKCLIRDFSRLMMWCTLYRVTRYVEFRDARYRYYIADRIASITKFFLVCNLYESIVLTIEFDEFYVTSDMAIFDETVAQSLF